MSPVYPPIENMIEQQIRPWGVLDQSILDLLYLIRREDFVPQKYKSLAYSDVCLPLCQTQKMLEPKVQAFIIQEIQPKDYENILLIGAGLGFIVALLSCLSRSVTAYEINRDLYQQAQKNLQKYSIKNVELINADGFAIKELKPFNKIIICGSISKLPQIFIEGLKVSGNLIYFERLIGHNNVMAEMKSLYKVSSESHKEEVLLQIESSSLLNDEINDPFIF
jgi:protein-L-isoaspartate(D-aspartate) O-methyltransferase